MSKKRRPSHPANTFCSHYPCMLHHASRLLSATSSTTSLTSILQTAAARAWTRRARVNDSEVDPSCPHSSTGSEHLPGVTAPPKYEQPIGVHPIDPDVLSNYDINWKDPGRVESMHYSDPPWNNKTLVAPVSLQGYSRPHFPALTSPESLYESLLRITTSRPQSASALINYHFHCARTFRSTHSYNLLVNLAIRHAAFGTAMRLFLAMREEAIPPNMETWKLIIRWLVRTGRWHEAWRRVSSIAKRHEDDREGMTKQSPIHSIPLPLWLELCGSQKRGALRRRDRPKMKGVVSLETYSSQSPSTLRPCPSEPSPAQAMFRSQIYVEIFRSLKSSELHPRAVLILTRAIIKAGRSDVASAMSSSYLKSLPSHLRPHHRQAVLRLVHLHMSTVPGKQGLSRHFAQRRVLFDFLDIHPGIRPSPVTLFLLLGSLRACRRCGTLALRCLQKFRKWWGPHIESSKVRRRVATLALKEGRLDIAENILQVEKIARRIKRGWSLQAEVLRNYFPQKSPRPFRGRPRRLHCAGVENRRWALLEKKFLKIKERRDKILRSPS